MPMKFVVFSIVLNHHQAPVADELWELTGHDFAFVELAPAAEMKGGTENFRDRPYLLPAWESQEAYGKAMHIACSAECCIFSGTDSLPFQKKRLKLGLPSLEMGERWLKHGWLSLASPRLMKWFLAYCLGGWSEKPLYKLCMGAFVARDHHKLGTFIDRCYKWGYFIRTEDQVLAEASKKQIESPSPCSGNSGGVSLDTASSDCISIMWCGRFLKWKHPELAVLLAQRLKGRNVPFRLKLYGDGALRAKMEQAVGKLGLEDVVAFHGNVSNVQVREAMKSADIFVFTSDRQEGWGAVAGESLSCGCALVASEDIGSVPYLIKEGYNGLIFKGPSPYSSMKNPDMLSLEDLEQKVCALLEHRDRMAAMQKNAVELMYRLWSPKRAAESLLQLICDLKSGRETSIKEGPCSKA